MKNLLLALFCCSTSLLFSQNTINGVVSDNGDGQAIFFATAALYNSEGTRVVKSGISDEKGEFVINDIADGEYLIEVSLLGYKSTERVRVQFPEKNGEVMYFKMDKDVLELEEVEVVAKVPLIEQRADRLIVNVSNSVLASSGSLVDAMKSVPGVITSNGRIRMAGQNNVTILIDGESTQYMDVQSLLQSIPADNIEAIEVIHQPGAEFEAAGTGPILNVVLKKKRALGTNGSVIARTQKNYKWLYGSGVFFSHYQNDINVNGYISYTSIADQETLDITRRVKNDIYNQTSVTPNDLLAWSNNLSIDWDITEKQRIGVTGQANFGDIDQVAVSTTDIDFSETIVTDINIITDNREDGNWDYLSINPYYSISFDTSTHKLEADFNLFRSKVESFNELITTNLNNTDTFFPGQRFDQPGEIRIHAFKLDYSKPLSNNLSLAMGGKYSVARLDNDLNVFFEEEKNIWVRSQAQSNLFEFNETIAAAYGKLNYKLGSWTGSVGLRYEDSDSEGRSVTRHDTINRRIRRFFPSFSIGRDIAGPIGATFAYSYRIDRPAYFDLNPFTTNLDPFTSLRGNPVLVPSLTHSMRFSLVYDGYPFFTAEYKNINDPMVEVTEQNDETGETFLYTVNLGAQRLFNSQFILPLDFLFEDISGFAGINVNYNEYDSEYLNQNFNPSKWTYNVFVRAQFNLPGDINAEIGGNYASGLLDGVIEIDDFYGVEIGFAKDFFDRKVNLSFGAEDIFVRFTNGEINFANMDIDFLEAWYTPELTFKLTYKFGNRFLKEKKARKFGAEEEINRTQQ